MITAGCVCDEIYGARVASSTLHGGTQEPSFPSEGCIRRMFAGAEVAPIGSRKHASRLPAYYWRRPLTL